VRDWTEGESDNDLTKNYPFPVPRIRDEFRNLMCTCDSHQTTAVSVPKKKDEVENYEDSRNTVISNNSVADHNSYTGDVLVRAYTDSRVPSPTNILPVPAIQRRVKSQRDYNHHNNPIKCAYCELNLSHTRRFTDTKSTAKEPRTASYKDVARARSKIQSKESQHQT